MNVLNSLKLDEGDLIRSILNSYFIVDYGYINKVNPDKTVNVTHAAKPVLTDGTELSETVTDNVEVLTISGSGFSIKWDYKAKDKVLLLGLKSYIPLVSKVTSAKAPDAFTHYDRSTIKALPLCVFSDEAKVKAIIENGKLTIDTEDKIELNGNTKQFVTWAELNSALQTLLTQIKSHTHPATSGTTSASLELATVTLDITSAKTKTVVTGG